MEIKDDNKVNFRQAGRNQNGKLAKGPLQDPINKTTTSSIPYKFETILYKNTNPKGFGASSQRVLRSEDICPGPGSYDYEASRLRSNTASFSKKGYGNGFVSQANRMLYRGYINSGPGPGAYSFVAKPFQVTHIVHEQKKDPSEELLKSKSLQTDVPGPGYYNADASRTQNRLPIANSVFKSGTGRYNMTANSNPPPGTYEVDRALTDKKPFKHFMGSSNFMLPSKKRVSKTAEDKQNVDHLLGKDEAVFGLGPGQYFKTDKEDELVLFNQKIQDKNSHTFLISNNTRFGEVIQRKVKRVENPGPGTYIPVTVGPEEKTLVSGAVFMSETARRPFKDVRNFVGPTKYNPELLPKKSYHLNINKMWV